VATVWGKPSYARAVDEPALESPVRYRTWLAAMTTEQRRALGPTRVNSSALFDERVLVLEVTGGWARVVVPSQKSPLDPRGYPGWIPARQLSASLPPTGVDIATVTAATTTLRAVGRDLEVSYSTRLPVLRRAGSSVEVWGPAGSFFARTTDVVVTAANAPALPRTANAIVADAKRFLGLAYLWDGSSAFGFDCSGITYAVFRTHGILLPRDSFGQAVVGRRIDRADLAPGDLVFFATEGKVHHVAMFIGDGMMLQAPRTGRSVEIVPLSTPVFAKEYAGARRFLP
jgi:cell wall-associated NlpC family hydrolase